MKTVDLRSDTVTQPTEGMREAMANAELGDDVYGEDPTVNRLQELAARRLGKEAALLVPSGTMANQIALHEATRPGDLVLATAGAHILRWESGAAAALSGVQITTLGQQEALDAEVVRATLPARGDSHLAPATLLALEVSHNSGGGAVPDFDAVAQIVAVARAEGLGTHLDGARLFNAALASERSVADWAAPFDTVSFCLSKGLGAPVGSVVCGSRTRIDGMHRVRKMFGGGMRQAGVLAAAGLYALENHVERLAEDHGNARRLAEGWVAAGGKLAHAAQTNIVNFVVPEPDAFVAKAKRVGVLLGASGPQRVRAVTHLGVTGADVDLTLGRLEALL